MKGGFNLLDFSWCSSSLAYALRSSLRACKQRLTEKNHKFMQNSASFCTTCTYFSCFIPASFFIHRVALHRSAAKARSIINLTTKSALIRSHIFNNSLLDPRGRFLA